MNVPIWIIAGYQLRDRPDSQNLNIDTFCSLPFTIAQCVKGTEKCPDAGILLNYYDDDCSQVYIQIKQAFRALTIGGIFKPYISYHDFRSSSVRFDNLGYKLDIFDIRCQEKFLNCPTR